LQHEENSKSGNNESQALDLSNEINQTNSRKTSGN